MKRLYLILLFTFACAATYGQSDGSNKTIDVYFSWGEYYKSCPYYFINNEHYVIMGDKPVKLSRKWVERKNPDSGKYESFYYSLYYLETELIVKEENPAAATASRGYEAAATNVTAATDVTAANATETVTTAAPEEAKKEQKKKKNSKVASEAKEVGRAVGEEVKKEVKKQVTERAKKAVGNLLRNILN